MCTHKRILVLHTEKNVIPGLIAVCRGATLEYATIKRIALLTEEDIISWFIAVCGVVVLEPGGDDNHSYGILKKMLSLGSSRP